jgi:hypothetical protein
MATQLFLLQLLAVVLGKFQMVLQVFGLLQLAEAQPQVLAFQTNGGAQVAVAVKSHPKLFQLRQEPIYQFQLVLVAQPEMALQLHLDRLLQTAERLP